MYNHRRKLDDFITNKRAKTIITNDTKPNTNSLKHIRHHDVPLE